MRAGAQPAPALIFMNELEQLKSLEQRKHEAHERAEVIRGGLQEAAVAYAKALEKEDWATLGYTSIEAWNIAEFGPDRFSPERRKEIHVLLTARGLTVRQIAKATGADPHTVRRDQAEAGGADAPPGNPRQQAARQREARNKETRKAEEMKTAQLREQVKQAIEDQAREGKPLSGRSIQRRLGLDDDRQLRKVWDDLHKAGEVTIQRPQKDEQAPPSATPAAGRPKNWNGKSNDKRARELRAAKHGATKGAADFAQFASEVNRMCVVLEAYDVRDYNFADMADMALLDAASIYDDLVSLGEWHSRALSAVTNWLGDTKVREKIEKLKDVTGRTPDEAATALGLAARLEAKLGAVLAAR